MESSLFIGQRRGSAVVPAEITGARRQQSDFDLAGELALRMCGD
jgi:hypothetical protein